MRGRRSVRSARRGGRVRPAGAARRGAQRRGTPDRNGAEREAVVGRQAASAERGEREREIEREERCERVRPGAIGRVQGSERGREREGGRGEREREREKSEASECGLVAGGHARRVGGGGGGRGRQSQAGGRAEPREASEWRVRACGLVGGWPGRERRGQGGGGGGVGQRGVVTLKRCRPALQRKSGMRATGSPWQGGFWPRGAGSGMPAMRPCHRVLAARHGRRDADPDRGAPAVGEAPTHRTLSATGPVADRGGTDRDRPGC